MTPITASEARVYVTRARGVHRAVEFFMDLPGLTPGNFRATFIPGQEDQDHLVIVERECRSRHSLLFWRIIRQPFARNRALDEARRRLAELDGCDAARAIAAACGWKRQQLRQWGIVPPSAMVPR